MENAALILNLIWILYRLSLNVYESLGENWDANFAVHVYNPDSTGLCKPAMIFLNITLSINTDKFLYLSRQFGKITEQWNKKSPHNFHHKTSYLKF